MVPTALIGRSAQLQALVDDFATARSGSGRSVLVRGPAGSGSGGLVARFREELGARQLGHRWLGTRGRPGDAAYAALSALLPTGGDGLEGLLADLGSVPVEARSAVVGDRLARALRSGDAPLVIAIDRADHLDRHASAALATAARALADSACLLVATVGEDGDWPADRVLRLGPLDPHDVRLLAEHLAPDDGPRARLLEALSGGLPGRMVSLSRWPDPRLPAADQLSTVHQRAAALVVAVDLADACLPFRALTDSARVPPGLARTLTARGVLGLAPGRHLEAPPPWVEIANQMLSPEDSRDVAVSVAAALDEYEAPWHVRARALQLAGDIPRAAVAWRAAADLSSVDSEARAECLARAFAAASAVRAAGPQDAEVDSLGALAHDCVDALLAVGRTDEALAVLDGVLARIPRRDTPGRARLLGQSHRASLQVGQHRDSDLALDQALALLPMISDPLTEAEIRTLDAMRLVLPSPVDAAEQAERACRAAEMAREAASDGSASGGSPASATWAAALGTHALALGVRGQQARSMALFDHALDVSEAAGDRALEARIAANRIYVLWRCGDLRGMDASLTSELARLGRDGLAEAAGGQLLVGRAVVLHTLGRWAELTEHLESTLADPTRLTSQVEILMRLIAVELVADLGRLSEARLGLAALSSLPGASDPEIAYERMSVRLTIATLAGDLPRADLQALADEATGVALGIAADPFAAARVRVGVLRLLGWSSDHPMGPVLGAPALVEAEASDPSGEDREDRATLGAVAPAELVALLAEERAWRTGTGWLKVVEAWRRLPMPHRGAWTQLSAALEAAHSGDGPTALALIAEARTTARALGAEPLQEAADRLDRQLGRRSQRSSGELTAREGDVVTQVCLGRTNREIAKALGMSERTVAVHLTRIFVKLGAGTRGEVAHIARHRGLIDRRSSNDAAG